MREIATPHYWIEEVIARDERKAVIVVIGIGHHKALITGIWCNSVVGTASEVVDLAADCIGTSKRVQVVSGVIVATAFAVDGICQYTALAVKARPERLAPRPDLAMNLAAAINNIDLARVSQLSPSVLKRLLETA
ncbi:MAG: hypothetical protein IPN78_13630 [Candidatus Accumulibacter sp.]|nr:hypothetical protein [Candidatus Accumulibacter propinquus]